MAVTVVGTMSTNSGSGNDLAPTASLPTGLGTSDFGVAVISVNSGTITITPPTGWTIDTSLGTAGRIVQSTTLSMWLMTKPLTASDSGVSQVGSISATSKWTFTGFVFRGSMGVLDAKTSAVQTTSTNLTHLAITPVAADCLELVLATVRFANALANTIACNVNWQEYVDLTSTSTSPRFSGFAATRQLVGQAGVAQSTYQSVLSTAPTNAAIATATIAPKPYEGWGVAA